MSVDRVLHSQWEVSIPSNLGKSALSRQEIVELLTIFNEQFHQEENQRPKEGYLVEFVIKSSGLAASLIPQGAERLTKRLLGTPQTKNGSCPFCPEELSKNKRIIDAAKRATTIAVKSLNGQILIVPKQHYSHWFEAPIELQADLLLDAIEIRNKYPESQNTPIELHCGSAAGQTVFHIHVRTNIYPE